MEEVEMKKEKEKFTDKPVYTWKSTDFASQERKMPWYILVTVTALVLTVLLYLQSMWSGIIFVLVAYLYLILTGLKPKMIECAVYEKGVVVDGRVVYFEEIKEFWLVEGLVSKFYFSLHGKISGQVVMPAKNAEVDKIREFLKNHLPEENHGEDLIEKINRWIKF